MRYHCTHLVGAVVLLGGCIALTGCAPPTTGAAAPEPIPVSVSTPVEQEVSDYAEFTARTAAIDSVEVRARVWGYLDQVNFKEGALVKKGDVLCELDPRPYQALVDLAKAQVARDEAQLKFDEAEYQRNLELSRSDAIAKTELDKSRSARDVDLANIAAAKALVKSRDLDLGYTKVTAPVSGRVSRYAVTVGNLVQAGEAGGTLLTTIVSVDPIYAYFDVDEHTVQRVRMAMRKDGVQSAEEASWPLALGLATEKDFPHKGTINFTDNQINPRTGTLRMRAVFSNSDEVLSPGYFARVRVPLGPPHKALLVSERALDSDQGQRILYVVNDKNEVVARPVRLGQMHDGLREITDGLKPGDRVIVNGLQRVRPGIIVEPKLVDMPTTGVSGQK